MKTPKKRKDECDFCRSRKCHNRIVSYDLSYDKIACKNHIEQLYEDSKHIKGRDMFSTAKLRRGDNIHH